MMWRITRSLSWYRMTAALAARNWRAVQQGTRSDHIFFKQALTRLLGCDTPWLLATAREYRDNVNAWRRLSNLKSASRKTDGYAKTLDVAEGFAVWALVKHERPRVVVELGTQRGLSARLWKEALNAYVPDHQLILCDLEDYRAFIADDEATFLRGDARVTLAEIFASRQVDLLFNDAHPYDLIKWSVAEALSRNVRILAFHDVGYHHPRAVARPETAQVPVDERSRHGDDYRQHGHWERHVMAELLDPRIAERDSVETDSMRIEIFDSLFGFGVALRN